MNNTFYFLRHGKTKIDENSPVSKWILSEVGQTEALEIAEKGEFANIDVIIASGEEKAYQTAKPLADKLGKTIVRFEELNELDRNKGGFLDAAKFDESVQETLLHPDVSVNNWETAGHAREQFSRKIDEIDHEYSGKNILIVGHGLTMSLYFAHLLGQPDKTHERIKQSGFCDWGIVKGSKVIKDIGKQECK